MSPSDTAVINTKMEYLTEKVETIHDMVKSHITQEESQLEKIRIQIETQIENAKRQAEKDFSRKWVEIVASFVIVTIATSLLGWFIVQQSNVNEFLIKNNYPSQK